ncbi:methicillin resistance protein [Verrucomicrobia bacterium]|nr:methicillin resistance protein [Verrucomicrobiota bacterium]
MNNKEKYYQLCLNEPSIPIYSQPWWIDSLVDSKDWNISLVENDNEIVATLPYVYQKKYGKIFLSQPLLTQSLGPWLRSYPGKSSSQISRQTALMKQLIHNLPRYDSFNQNFHYSLTNWLPFYWLGFKQTTKYTYVINNVKNLEDVWSNFTSSYRNKIRKAQKVLVVDNSFGIEDFYPLYKMTFQRQNLDAPLNYNKIKAHDEGVKKNNKRKIFVAKDNLNNLHSALYLTWDENSSYVHLVGENPKFRKSGAGILLIWEALIYTCNELRINRLDFEGSMLENVEKVRRDCGAKQIPYFFVTKTNSVALQLYNCIKTIG